MIRSFFFGRCLSLSVVAAVAVSGGCTTTKPRTQVMLVVEADPEVQMQATSLRVEIEGRPLGTEMYSLTSDTTYPPPDSDMMWPYSIALIPRGGEINREFRITATAYSGTDAIARLRAESGFVSAKTIELKLRFQKSCLHAASLDCDPTQTCLDGYCVPARIDQTMLPTFTGDPEVIIPVGDGGQGTTSNPVSTAGAGGAAGSGMSVGTSGAGGAGGDPSLPGNCGDGKITGDEKCDIAIPDGMAGACPKECLKASACERSQLEGTGCQTRCTPSTITEFDSGDGCCPEGADANSDTDCRSSCGNGSIEAGEACDPIEMCPTAATCVSLNACLKAVVLGDAAACTAQCNMQPIVECMSGDGCCPSTCTNATDSDCSASCGNGTIEAGEVCEPNSAQMPCPTTCDDGNACTTDLLTGSANNCNSACTNVPITAPKNDDGCCPSGANANNDNDCDPICGNRIVEAGERCDGRCPTAATCGDLFACTRDGIMGSGCSVQCTHDVILTPAANDGCCPVGANQTNDNDCQPVCGNGVKERGEGCDGVLPASGGCPTEASCNDNNPCTNDGVAGSACNLACTHQKLTSATPVDGANCCRDGERVACGPVCGNSQRESGEGCDDGNTRNGDGCSSTCQEEPPPASCGDGSVNQANEQCDDGNTRDGDGCSSTCKNEPPPARCGDGDVNQPSEQCDDGNTTSGDGCSSTCQNEPPPARCGDGDVNQPSEQCDDGNTTSGDGCSSTCKNEPPPARCGDGDVNQPSEQCDDGNTTSGDGCSSTCKTEPPPARCGDGDVNQPNEQCDDGNATSGDGCSSTCMSEPPPARCGDGAVNQPSEQCDDGNTMSGDGCSSTCKNEPPPARCGDGAVNQPSEQCDDGNTASGDGCSSTCKNEIVVIPDGGLAP